MFHEKLIQFFLPAEMRNNKEHPRYHEFYTLASPVLAGVISIAMVPLILMAFGVGRHLWLYYLNAGCNLLTLLSMRWLGHYRLFNITSGIVTYFIIYTWLEDNGLIYSANMCVVHMFLLGSVLTDKKWGWLGIFTNIAFISFIYFQTVHTAQLTRLENMLGSPAYTFAMHVFITIFLGGFLASTIRTQEENRKEISQLQDHKINVLDEAVRKRTRQLNSMRQTIATDFHDQTGNMLAAINRQAAMLELKLHDRPDILPLVQSIIGNSNELYASSKDFLWNLNHDSDNPATLFKYLMAYGQNFYNQFDIAFSASVTGTQQATMQLDPFAALNLIYIFKEAMSNSVKHSGADEVMMKMIHGADWVTYELADNGQWKEAASDIEHYGLGNMERRSRQSNFGYQLSHNENGTCISVSLPLSVYSIKNETT